MAAAARVLMLILMSVMPGGLFFIAGYVLVGMVTNRMKADSGPQGARFGRAIAAVRWKDVLQQARRLV